MTKNEDNKKLKEAYKRADKAIEALFGPEIKSKGNEKPRTLCKQK